MQFIKWRISTLHNKLLTNPKSHSRLCMLIYAYVAH